MARDEQGERTEQPTERRRTEAREKGQVARSTDLNAAAILLAVAGLILVAGGPFAGGLASLLRTSLARPPRLEMDYAAVARDFESMGRSAARIVLPWMLAVAGTALAANLMQVGFLVSPSSLQPKLSRLSPLEGAKRILSLQSLVRLAVNLGKLAVMIGVCVVFVRVSLPEVLSLVQAEAAGLLTAIRTLTGMLALQLALALLLLALLDFAFQKWKHEQDLKMTQQEVRDELKQMEGDPHIRQRRRDAHRKLAEAREIQQVPDADVVVTNPTHVAVALKYDPQTMPAPTVVAKGMGEVAQRIREVAVQHGVPIVERKQVARTLYRTVQVGQPVPVDMYEVFVEIMSYVYRITGRTPPAPE